MRSQPNRDYISDDVVQTPPALARRLVEHFRPRGRVLEPCKGRGNFLRALRTYAQRTTRGAGSARGRTGRAEIAWCEIKCGRDFYHWTERVDWIMTNPPWSQVRRFLQQAMLVSDHVVFLVTINHVWTRARVSDIRAAGFGLREIVLLDMPATFPQSGFQLGAVHFARGWKGATRVTDWTRGAVRALKHVGAKLRRTVARLAGPSRAAPRGRTSAARAAGEPRGDKRSSKRCASASRSPWASVGPGPARAVRRRAHKRCFEGRGASPRRPVRV